MANRIMVIGIGPGAPEFIMPIALEQIHNAEILICGERTSKVFTELKKELYIIKNNLDKMVEFIRENYLTKNIAVLASGDPAFYGILEYLKKNFTPSELEVLPGVSSVQLACAKLCISWHDAAFFSVHGRSIKGLVELVRDKSKVIVLTDPIRTPATLAKELLTAGIANKKIWVCEQLSYHDEFIGQFDIYEIPATVGKSGSVMVILDE